MNIKLLRITEKPLEIIYIAYRACYSKYPPTKIKIPNNINKIEEFIKDKIDKGHTSPLEHCNFTFSIEGVSRSLSHQLVRHRIAAYSQQSQRYVSAENFDFVIPNSIKEKDWNGCYNQIIKEIGRLYDSLVEMGVPKEDARFILPNATATNLLMTMNLREFRHFYAERSCINAQWEIRKVAEECMKQVKEYIPIANYKAKKCGITCMKCKCRKK